MKIGELARRSGLSVHSIRYYERIGLLPRPGRDRSGQRDYDDAVLAWIAFLASLKAAGMPIADMVRYTALWQRGPGTEAQRRTLLESQRTRVHARLAELQSCLRVIDRKIADLIKLEQG